MGYAGTVEAELASLLIWKDQILLIEYWKLYTCVHHLSDALQLNINYFTLVSKFGQAIFT